MSAVKIKKHVNLSSPLLPELVACLLTNFFLSPCLPMMYKGGKNHIKPADFLNFYMSEKGRRGGGAGNQREYQSWEKYGNTSVRK